MAQKRMLNKSISISKQVRKLSLKHKLFFTWAIPHLDDYGLLDKDLEILKVTICPLVKEITEKDIQEFIDIAQTIRDENGDPLIIEHKDCVEFPGFSNHQSISPDKRAKCKFNRTPKNPQENSGENNNSQETPEFTQNKLREEKLREEKREEGSTHSQNYLKKIPANDLEEFHKNYNATKKQIEQKGEDLFDWCESTGKRKKSYKAFLRTILLKDFGRREKVATPPPEKPYDPERAKRNAKEMDNIKKSLSNKLSIIKKPQVKQ